MSTHRLGTAGYATVLAWLTEQWLNDDTGLAPLEPLHAEALHRGLVLLRSIAGESNAADDAHAAIVACEALLDRADRGLGDRYDAWGELSCIFYASDLHDAVDAIVEESDNG